VEEPNERLDQRSALDYHRSIPKPDLDPTRSLTASEAKHRHGEELTAISDGLVALLKEFYGRGPTQTKSYYQDDLVVCLLRGGYTQVEQTLLDGGRGSAVIEQRMEFQELMRERFEEVIERATGRKVIGFMSGNQQEPDMMCEVFVLEPPTSSETPRGARAARTRVKRRFQGEVTSGGHGFEVPSEFATGAAPRDFLVEISQQGETMRALSRSRK